MKRALYISLLVVIVFLVVAVLGLRKTEDSDFAGYTPNAELQQAEPLMANLPSVHYIDSIISADYCGKHILNVVVESGVNGPELKILAADSINGQQIDINAFVLPYTKSLDAVVMPKRVEWRQFAGVPYYRVDNGYEAENVNASTDVATPFILSKSLLVKYIQERFGRDCEYSIEQEGAVYSVIVTTNSDKYHFLINILTFEIKDI